MLGWPLLLLKTIRRGAYRWGGFLHSVFLHLPRDIRPTKAGSGRSCITSSRQKMRHRRNPRALTRSLKSVYLLRSKHIESGERNAETGLGTRG